MSDRELAVIQLKEAIEDVDQLKGTEFVPVIESVLSLLSDTQKEVEWMITGLESICILAGENTPIGSIARKTINPRWTPNL